MKNVQIKTILYYKPDGIIFLTFMQYILNQIYIFNFKKVINI